MTHYGYARVSSETRDQSIEVQKGLLLKLHVPEENIFFEIESAAEDKFHKRLKLEALLSQLKPDDIITVTKLDRLGRSLKDVMQIMTRIKDANAFINITNVGDTSTSTGRLIINILASVAEFERELISERTKSGMAKYHKERNTGHLRNQGGLNQKLTNDNEQEIVTLAKSGATHKLIAERFNVNKSLIPQVINRVTKRNAK